MFVVKQIQACREAILTARSAGQTVGLVPTLGALHNGHISLIQAAQGQCDFVAVTIFVNPSQFHAEKDLDQYPRPLKEDLSVCSSMGVKLVFTPESSQMYEPDSATTVHVAGVTESLCGTHRPGHFDGVATVVAKLFNILPAHRAYFGEKDFQQLVMVRRMVADLNIPIEIVPCPTVREEDGLALSSRNAHLAPDQRSQATFLSRALFDAEARVRAGEHNVAALIHHMRQVLEEAPLVEIEYIEVVDEKTLTPLEVLQSQARICLAVTLGATRLIDNIAVDARGDRR